MSKIGFGRKVKKLTNLRLKEISGVDHPASLHEGWAVMKNTDNELTSELTEIINNEQNLENEVETEVQKEESVVETDVVENEVESTDVAKELADVKKELADAKAEVSQLKEDSAMEKAQTDAQKWAIVPQLDPVEFAPVLRSLRSFDTEVSEQIENILDAVAVALGEAGILKEIGSDGSPEHEDTYGQIESIAKSMVEEGTVGSLAEGISKVAVDQPELYSAYVAEQRGA
tara:strand:+ start:729 stop:1418 length:690 start_codon:yes stop_codon:yes gene_type:complete